MIHWAKAIQDTRDTTILDFYTNINKSSQKKFELDEKKYLDLSFSTQQKRILKLMKIIKKFGLLKCDIEYVPHHIAHHASNWFTTNKKIALAISLDGRGDALSGLVSICKKNKIKPIHEISSFNSIGLFYSAINVSLGFKAVRHEGKITGLAAFGNPNKKLLKKYKKLIWFNSKKGSIYSSLFTGTAYGPYPWANFKVYIDKIKIVGSPYSREDVAATAQFHLERVVREFVSY